MRRTPAQFGATPARLRRNAAPRPRTATTAHPATTRHAPHQVLTAKMNLSDDVDLEDYVSRPEKISGAEIACVVQEAGMQAVRSNRYVVLPKDFEAGYKSNTQKNDKDFEFYK